MDHLTLTGRDADLLAAHASAPVAAGSVHVLVPVKDDTDGLYGVRYAGNLIDWGVPVKATIVHVTAPDFNSGALFSSRKVNGAIEDARATGLVRHVCRQFANHKIPHGGHIVSGDVVFSILDTAELLGCDEIVLPRPAPRFWPRLFANNIVGEMMRASRGVPVLLIDEQGLVSRSAN